MDLTTLFLLSSRLNNKKKNTELYLYIAISVPFLLLIKKSYKTRARKVRAPIKNQRSGEIKSKGKSKRKTSATTDYCYYQQHRTELIRFLIKKYSCDRILWWVVMLWKAKICVCVCVVFTHQ